jgi:hypothetical protein
VHVDIDLNLSGYVVGDFPGLRRRLLERGPAPIVFMASGPDLAGVVQQPLPNVLPNRRRPIEA